MWACCHIENRKSFRWGAISLWCHHTFQRSTWGRKMLISLQSLSLSLSLPKNKSNYQCVGSTSFWVKKQAEVIRPPIPSIIPFWNGAKKFGGASSGMGCCQLGRLWPSTNSGLTILIEANKLKKEGFGVIMAFFGGGRGRRNWEVPLYLAIPPTGHNYQCHFPLFCELYFLLISFLVCY